ncbi:hypothetical protein [Bordetella flabilis]|uniref:Uncharacterized protein n=1 Tax=Bordetella flabilis TaxID=463014 RepID=A0A193GGI1_9BORD|nr:hypothetical protein [Bordetella flabilis]ANN78925.1 hypothetical protein BAU07_18980 [Bordetella flabilis]
MKTATDNAATTRPDQSSEHEDFERWAASHFGVLTVPEYRVALESYLEGRREQRSHYAKLLVIADPSSTQGAPHSFNELVRQGQERN